MGSSAWEHFPGFKISNEWGPAYDDPQPFRRLRILLVGERWNHDAIPRWSARSYSDPSRWLELSLRAGCMGTGLSRRDGLGERKLRSIGLRWTAGLNLLPPSPVVGEWNYSDARSIVLALQEKWEVAAASMFLRGNGSTSLPDEYRTARWMFNVVVLLGRRVERAFVPGATGRIPYLEPVLTNNRGLIRITVPHPSGQNRWWNSDQRRAKASAAVGKLLAEMESRIGRLDDCRDARKSADGAGAGGAPQS